MPIYYVTFLSDV